MYIQIEMKKKQKEDTLNKIYNDDSRNILNVVDNSIRIKSTITSPPYFDMKDYGSENQVGFGQTYMDYLEDLKQIFENIYQITDNDGSLWIIIDTFKRENQVVTLPFDLSNKLKESGWLLQDIIIWKKDKTVPWSNNGFVQRKFEYILFFSKSEKFKYNKDRVRNFDTDQLKKWWVKYPERYNPKGKALDEIWEFSIPVQGSWGNQYIRHFCPLPKEMVATMIEISTDKNDVILDPFAGSGSVLFQSSVMYRNYVGFELNSSYIEMFNNYNTKTFKKARKEYDLLQHITNQEDFKNRILGLRALKYARVLITEIDKLKEFESFKIFTKIKEESQIKNKLIVVEYTIIGNIERNSDLMDILNTLSNKPPLSKYGIEPLFIFSENMKLNKIKHFGYTKSNTYSFQKNVNLNSSVVRVISDICVDLNENDYL